MVVMQQAMRKMVKAAQKFARRTAAAVKLQVCSRRSLLPRYQCSYWTLALQPLLRCREGWQTVRIYTRRSPSRSLELLEGVSQGTCRRCDGFWRNLLKQALVQALARGYLARCEFRRRRAQRRAVEDVALAVIRPWARTAAARLHFLRLRCRLPWALIPLP